MATQTLHFENIKLAAARQNAILYEAQLNADSRKKLGQFFTGLPLARLLAALSVRSSCKTVIDPMAGTGDLLDAVVERSVVKGFPLQRVDAIEIDALTLDKCKKRLEPWTTHEQLIQTNFYLQSAFETDQIFKLHPDGYDLVITNPPYVRYQTISNDNGRKITPDAIRNSLLKIIDHRIDFRERPIWRKLVNSYSGLSDLSVPSWFLSAMLVKPGGVLGIVAPATWRNRNYAAILQYMLERFFSLEIVVADSQPGWFSTALVRTNLVIASRNEPSVTIVPLYNRSPSTGTTSWLEVAPSAKQGESLVGGMFTGDNSEDRFSSWVTNEGTKKDLPGLTILRKPMSDEMSSIVSKSGNAQWFTELEPLNKDTNSKIYSVPHELRQILKNENLNISTLEALGIRVSQGLRTGCNNFFYLDFVRPLKKGMVEIEASMVFTNKRMQISLEVLSPVLRRQAELSEFVSGGLIIGRVLDLRHYVLPEHYEAIHKYKSLYRKLGQPYPRIMSKDLADFVRRASTTKYGVRESKYIPDLSAVKTNVRSASAGKTPQLPRFWYMLPDFSRRHFPDVFVPRINQDAPEAFPNRKPPILIDANFSVLWGNMEPWSSLSIVALLNSSWCRACMEKIGTPMGGGALKLEATHLREMPVPQLSDGDIHKLQKLGTFLKKKNEQLSTIDAIDRIIIKSILGKKADDRELTSIHKEIRQLISAAVKARQRGGVR